MVTILLVTITKIEAQAVLEVFPSASGVKWQRRYIGDKTYYDLGYIGGAEMYMVQSEMGSATPGGAIITIHNAIEALEPDAVIMVGIAFGINPDKQKMGEILVSKQIMTYEPQKLEGEKIIPRGDRVTCSGTLLDKFRSGDLDWSGAKVSFGVVLSGEKLVANEDFRTKLLELEPEAIGGEMEGAGLYVAAKEANVDWILVKAICDWADGEKKDDAQPMAAKNAASFVLHVILPWGKANSRKESDKSRKPKFLTPTDKPQDAILLGEPPYITPFIDRDDLRKDICVLAKYSVDLPHVLIIRGDQPCGKSYSWNLIRHFAATSDVVAKLVCLGHDPLTPVELVKRLARRLDLDLTGFPNLADDPQLAHDQELIDWFMGRVGNLKEPHLLGIDDLNYPSITPAILETTYKLAHSIEDERPKNLCLVLLGFNMLNIEPEFKPAYNNARFPDLPTVASHFVWVAQATKPLDPTKAHHIATTIFERFPKLDKESMLKINDRIVKIDTMLVMGEQPI